VGTFGGLAVLDPFSSDGPYRFRTISTAQGLASNKINAALPDANGNLWLSMSNGIAMVDGSTGAVYNLDTRDGLQIPSYIHIAAAVSPGGELLFGGQGGLTVIRPDLHSPSSRQAPLAITAAKVNGDALPFGRLPKNNVGFGGNGRLAEGGAADVVRDHLGANHCPAVAHPADYRPDSPAHAVPQATGQAVATAD
jgi:hypothetical protein